MDQGTNIASWLTQYQSSKFIFQTCVDGLVGLWVDSQELKTFFFFFLHLWDNYDSYKVIISYERCFTLTNIFYMSFQNISKPKNTFIYSCIQDHNIDWILFVFQVVCAIEYWCEKQQWEYIVCWGFYSRHSSSRGYRCIVCRRTEKGKSPDILEKCL